MATERLSDTELFRKYGGGRTPPLVSSPDTRFGLVNDKLLEIYQRGFSDVHDVPLGVLLVGETSKDQTKDKWQAGNYVYNQRARAGWSHLCRLIRDYPPGAEDKPGDRHCEQCDRDHAITAENKNCAVAYLCRHGMIDFAVPVRLANKTIAVLFCGQLRPNRKETWPPDLVDTSSAQKILGDDMCDLPSLSKKLLAKLADDYGISNDLLKKTIKRDEANDFRAVGPEQVQRLLGSLNIAAMHLSELATRTHELEKARLASLVRFEFTKPLIQANKETSVLTERINELRHALELLHSFLGLEFVAMCRTIKPGRLHIYCQVGLDGLFLKEKTVDFIPRSSPDRSDNNNDSYRVIELNDYKEIPAADYIRKLYIAAGRNNPSCLCVTPKETPDFMLTLGKSVASHSIDFTEGEIELLDQIASVACLVTETLCLLDDLRQSRDALRQSHEAMDKFVEDVAHDLRGPVQTIITKAAMLKQSTLQPHEYVTQASRLAAAVMRIHLVAQRVWMVQRLHRGELVYNDINTSIRERMAKVVDTLTDESQRKNLEIAPEWDSFENLPNIRVDDNVFFEVLLNLVDNAVKYSTTPGYGRRAQVVVKAWHSTSEIVISIGNRGIEIPKEEIPKIFLRYYRSARARRLRPDGSGIGLSIVKDFIDHYHYTIEVLSTPISGTQDFLTRFEIHMKK